MPRNKRKKTRVKGGIRTTRWNLKRATIAMRYDSKAIREAFGDVIWWRREDLGLSRFELGRLCGKGYSFVQRIETGHRITLPRVDEFHRLMKALGLTHDDLLEAAGYHPSYTRAADVANQIIGKVIEGDKITP